LRQNYALITILKLNLMKQYNFSKQSASVNSTSEITYASKGKKTAKMQFEAVNARMSSEMIQKETNKRWMFLETTHKYRRSLAKETGNKTTEALKSELLDGLFITLNGRNNSKSDKEQARLVRRIVEKRQAQAAHHKIGRTDDLYASKVSRGNACKCMLAIRQQMYAMPDTYMA
jgi:hypothetical protein